MAWSNYGKYAMGVDPDTGERRYYPYQPPSGGGRSYNPGEAGEPFDWCGPDNKMPWCTLPSITVGQYETLTGRRDAPWQEWPEGQWSSSYPDSMSRRRISTRVAKTTKKSKKPIMTAIAPQKTTVKSVRNNRGSSKMAKRASSLFGLTKATAREIPTTARNIAMKLLGR